MFCKRSAGIHLSLKIARDEFPTFDVTVQINFIGRRLQDFG
jgi:hypothetical protein